MGTYGVSDKGFIRSANATALMAGKGYYLDTTGSMRFGDPAGGYIKFTESEGVTIAGSVSISGTATIGGTSATTVKDGAAAGATAQQNNSDKTDGKVGGWKIDSDSIFSGTKDTSGYSTTGITLYSGGSIHAPQFYIDTSGNAFFKGSITGASGTFSDTVSGATISGGTISGTTISGTTITGGTLSGTTITGGTINIGPNKFSVDSSGNATVAGNMNVNSNVIIRGWKDIRPTGLNPFEDITPGGNFEFRDPDTTSTVMGFLRGYKTIYNFGFPGVETTERNTVLAALTSFVFGQYAGNPWATLDGTKLQVWGDVVANYSDGRLKNIEGRIENPLDKIEKLNGVYYTQNKLAEDFGFKNKKRQIGLIAQEVNEVLPEVIDLAPFDSLGQTNQSKSGENYMTLNYERIVPLLVECIKELKSEIEELKRNR